MGITVSAFFAGVVLGASTWHLILSVAPQSSDHQQEIDDAVTEERNRCAGIVRNPDILHCPGFRFTDRQRLADKLQEEK